MNAVNNQMVTKIAREENWPQIYADSSKIPSIYISFEPDILVLL